MNYTFSVVELAAKQVIGINIKTDMESAANDGPALWESFFTRTLPQLEGCNALAKDGLSYGISQMINEQQFIYWAGVEVTSIDALPEGLELTTIPEGLYVTCTASSLAELADVYNALYIQWHQSQNEYAFDTKGISFELYPKHWTHNSPLEIFAAVIRK